MPCYSPLRAWRTSGGEIVFAERRQHNIVRELELPCGQCIGCRLERSRQWAMRCLHEASLHKRNSFVTLTYAEDKLPYRNNLDYTEFQRFMKRLRKHTGPNRVRFYMCGEYGEQTGRPHFHACLFGTDFDDKEYYAKSPSGEKLFTSPTLEKLWGNGFAPIGAITFESAAYVARYVVQKVTGHNARAHYTRVDNEGKYTLRPEFNKMSLKPGIGAGWLQKYTADVYPHDYVVIRGKEMKPPKYYDQQYEKQEPDKFEQIKWNREKKGLELRPDNTNERLAVKQEVQQARLNQLKRGKAE